MKIRVTLTSDAGEVYTVSLLDVDPDAVSPRDSMSKVTGRDDEGDPCTLGDLIIGAARWAQENEEAGR